MNRLFFGQFVEHHVMGVQFAAFDETDRAVGFATLYFLPSSLSARTYCVLNDLFTTPECRGRGVARKLLGEAARYAKERGFATLEWQTQKENKTAQRLYDRLGASKSAWYTYVWRTT